MPDGEPERRADEWLTKLQAAEVAHVSVRTIERAIADGKLRAGGTPRRRLILRVWLDEWLSGGTFTSIVVLLLLLYLFAVFLGCACGIQGICDVLNDLHLALRQRT